MGFPSLNRRNNDYGSKVNGFHDKVILALVNRSLVLTGFPSLISRTDRRGSKFHAEVLGKVYKVGVSKELRSFVLTMTV